MQYPVSAEMFRLFVKECKFRLGQAGVKNVPVTFIFDKPPAFMGENVLACVVTFKHNQRMAVYLNPTWHRKPNVKAIRYLVLHEIVENVLQEAFRSFTETSLRNRKIDEDEWKKVVHSAMHRLLFMIEPKLMTDIGKGWL